jgi:hypothetical protein
MTISCELHHIHHNPWTELPLTFFCFLFRHLKNLLQGRQFGSTDKRCSGVRQILNEMRINTLEVVFRE